MNIPNKVQLAPDELCVHIKGRVGSGKSTLAAKIVKALNAEGVQVKVVEEEEWNPSLFRRLAERPAVSRLKNVTVYVDSTPVDGVTYVGDYYVGLLWELANLMQSVDERVVLPAWLRSARNLLAKVYTVQHRAEPMTIAPAPVEQRGGTVNQAEVEFLRQRSRRLEEAVTALQSILEIGKRDMTNPKYDDYFTAAETALANVREGGGATPGTACKEADRLANTEAWTSTLTPSPLSAGEATMTGGKKATDYYRAKVANIGTAYGMSPATLAKKMAELTSGTEASVPPSAFQSFHAAAEPLVKWLAENGRPKYKAVVSATGAELLEWLAGRPY